MASELRSVHDAMSIIAKYSRLLSPSRTLTVHLAPTVR